MKAGVIVGWLCVVWAVLAAQPVAARNVALVIGNAAYSQGNSLTNPVNDARVVAAGARRAGFQVVERNDLDKPAFERALRDFLQLANGADVAMIYYAGHGIEAQGKNWLLPIDAKLGADFDLPYEAVELDRLLEALSGSQVRMVVLDACRNNPFGKNWRRGFRSVPSGLAQFETDDFLVIYAAAPGQVATDGAGSNSPFALSLARRLPEAGLPVQLLGGKVRDDVMGATGGAQRPFTSGSITGTPIYLVPAAAVAPQPLAAPVGAPNDAATDALLWQGAVSADTIAAYQSYLRTFPNGLFGKLARDKIASLGAAGEVGPSAPVAALPAPVAVPVQVAAPVAVVAAPPPMAASVGMTAPAVVAAPPTAAAPVAEIVLPAPTPVSEAAPTSAALALPLPQTGVGAGGLPLLPPTPQFPAGGYPACREEYQAIPDGIAKVESINRCTVVLDSYFRTVLVGYRESMIQHQEILSRLYSEKVGGTGRFAPDLQDQFYRAMMQEHGDSRPDGAHFADHRAAEARYKEDRAHMADRYCFMTGCNGYPGQTFYKDPVAGTKPAQ